MASKYIMVFLSNSQGIYIYNKLIRMNINVELIPTPAEIISGCSKSIMYDEKYNRIVIEEAKKINAAIKGIYILSGKNKYTKK